MYISSQDNRIRSVRWILLVVVMLQAVGLGTRYLFTEFESESDVYGWLYFDYEFPEDAGEQDERRREQLAQRVDDVGNWIYLAATGLLVFTLLVAGAINAGRRDPIRGVPSLLWQGPLLLYLVVWAAMLDTAQMVRDGDEFAKWAFGEHAVRIFTPLALLMLLPRLGRQAMPGARVIDAVGLLRFAAAATFVVHGLKAIYLHGPFVDLILHSAENLAGPNLSVEQDDAILALRIIGAVDLLAAVLLVTTRLRVVALYMACWGFITAASRMTATGFGPYADPFTIGRYGDFLIRAANWGVPLAIFVFWHMSRTASSTSNQR